MGREAGAHSGGGLGVAAQAWSMRADLQFAPLPAAVDPDRAWIEEGLRRALAQIALGGISVHTLAQTGRLSADGQVHGRN